MNNDLPIFLNNPSTKEILDQVIPLIPEGTEVYLFGGAVRNALYFKYFEEEMTQRDFDCIVIGDGETFAQNLVNAGFIFGSKNTEKSKVLKKVRIAEPVHQYDDWLYLDCKIYPLGETADGVMNRISDFTISGVALNLKYIESNDWQERVVAIPKALEDIQEKQLTVVKAYSISLHKIIRMVSRGFKKPSEEEVGLCLEKMKDIPEDKFITNTEKTIRYVGSEDEVLKISKDIGINFDILKYEEVKKP